MASPKPIIFSCLFSIGLVSSGSAIALYGFLSLIFLFSFEGNSEPLAISEICRQSTEMNFANEASLAMTTLRLAMSPSIEKKELGLVEQLYSLSLFPRETLVGNVSDTWQGIFESYKEPVPISYIDNIEIRRLLDEAEPHAQMAKLKANLSLVCVLFSEQVACKKAMNDVAEIQDPRLLDSNCISYPETIQKLATTNYYHKGIIMAAKKILTKLKQVKKGVRRGLGHLYSDLTESFHSAGLTPFDSAEAALDILGVYGSRGCKISPIDRASYVY